MSETPTDTSEAGAWLPLADAARFYRVTIRTLDRRRLPKRHLVGRPVEVWVAGATSDDVSDDAETPQDIPPTVEERALALSDSVSDIISQHTAPLYARIEVLARENGELAERLKASETQADADRQRLRQEVSSLDATARVLAEDAARADDLAQQLAESQAILAAERAAREAAEQRLKDRRWWNPATW
ncbi:MAG TPA: hypothetical protein VMT30_09410 [Candidatus Saccharimonadia bacterium]|nr:hypothetical protein [Candidatus Saccharimonadia bacterium]